MVPSMSKRRSFFEVMSEEKGIERTDGGVEWRLAERRDKEEECGAEHLKSALIRGG